MTAINRLGVRSSLQALACMDVERIQHVNAQ